MHGKPLSKPIFVQNKKMYASHLSHLKLSHYFHDQVIYATIFRDYFCDFVTIFVTMSWEWQLPSFQARLPGLFTQS